MSDECCDPARTQALCADCCARCGDYKSVEGTDHCQRCLDAYHDALDLRDREVWEEHR
jgi:hypothetical protein